MRTNDVQVLAIEFDGVRSVNVTFVDPQRDSPAATEVTQLHIAPELYADELNEIVDDVLALIEKVQVAIRNPPSSIRRR